MTATLETQARARNVAIPLHHIARSFGQAAARYDEFAALQREVADELLTGIEVAAPATVLDLGCGTGYCAARLGSRFTSAQLLALDLALPMLHASAARVPHATPLLCADLQALPLQAGSAHLAISSLALQWCSDPQRVFAELWRVLRPGGQALLSTFGPATLRELRAAWRAVDAHVHVNGFPDKALLARAAGNAGFTVNIKRDLQARYYPSLRALARELKGIGAHNMNDARPPGLTPRAAFARAEQAFGKGLVAGQGIPVTWEVYYLDLRKPR
jgi:malonyl-CoA O-methyltransferase